MLRSHGDRTFNGGVSLVANWDTSRAIVPGVNLSMGKGRNILLTEKLMNLDFTRASSRCVFSKHPHLLEALVSGKHSLRGGFSESDHKVQKADYLKNVKRMVPGKIILGNGHAVFAESCGDMFYYATVETDSREYIQRKLILRNVLCVPKLKSNVISCAALCEEGRDMKSISHATTFTAKKHNESVFHGKKKLGVYRSKGKMSSNSVAHSKVSVPESLWHMRIGHAHIGSIRKLYSTGAATGLHLSELHNNSASCQSCISGKMTKRVAKMNPFRAASVGDAMKWHAHHLVVASIS